MFQTAGKPTVQDMDLFGNFRQLKNPIM